MNAKSQGYVKVGLAAILGLVFIFAIANCVNTLSGPKPPVKPPRSPAGAPPAPTSTSAIQVQQSFTTRTWPVFAIADIVAHDPFALSPLDSKLATTTGAHSGIPGTKDSAQAGTDGQNEGAGQQNHRMTSRIQAIYQRGHESAVLIDSRTLRPGDSIQGTGRIVEVDHAGIVIELEK